MKGSMGAGLAAGISTGGVGLRSSGVALATKSVGGSFSPEARFGGNRSSFSSRSLSTFNREAISRPTVLLVNSSFGREKKSPFARSSNLVPKGMFDVRSPVSKNRVVPYERTASASSIGLNINKGKEAKPSMARLTSLAPKGILFDISKPVSKNNLVSGQERLRPDVLQKVIGVANKRSVVETKHQTSKTEKKTRIKPFERIELKHIVRVSPQASFEASQLIYKDIKDAKKMIPIIMRARGVSHRIALAEMAQVLGKKHEGKIVITPHDPKAQPQLISEIKAVQKTHKDVKVGKVLKDSDSGKEQQEHYYFAKDKKTNTNRKERILGAFKKILKNKEDKEAVEMTGWDLEMTLWEKPKDKEFSEITRPFKMDDSLNRLFNAVKFLGHFVNLHTIHTVLDNLIEYYSAIRLTKNKDEGIQGKDAEVVYGQALHYVPAHVESQTKIGLLDASSNARRLITIRRNDKETSKNIIYKEAV